MGCTLKDSFESILPTESMFTTVVPVLSQVRQLFLLDKIIFL